MRTTIQIQNLKCGGCANTIVTKLSILNGVDGVVVDEETTSVTLEYQSSDSLTAAKDRLKALGYPTIEDENGILQKAKSFVSCANGRFSS